MKKIIKTTLICLITTISTLISIPFNIFAQPDKKMLYEIELRLKTILLQDWSLSSKDNIFILSRKTKVQLYNDMSMYVARTPEEGFEQIRERFTKNERGQTSKLKTN